MKKEIFSSVFFIVFVCLIQEGSGNKCTEGQDGETDCKQKHKNCIEVTTGVKYVCGSCFPGYITNKNTECISLCDENQPGFLECRKKGKKCEIDVNSNTLYTCKDCENKEIEKCSNGAKSLASIPLFVWITVMFSKIFFGSS